MSLVVLLKESIREVLLKPLVALMPLSFFSLLRADASHLAGPEQHLLWLSAARQHWHGATHSSHKAGFSFVLPKGFLANGLCSER